MAKIVDGREQLRAFYDFPAALGAPEDVEPDRVDLRHGTAANRVTKGPGRRAAGLAMVFKLLQAAEEHWRYVNGAHLVALVRAGAEFEKGVLVERRPERQGGRRVIVQEPSSTTIDDPSEGCDEDG